MICILVFYTLANNVFRLQAHRLVHHGNGIKKESEGMRGEGERLMGPLMSNIWGLNRTLWAIKR